MSTRGTFIIRKGDTEKALYIASDAYPSYTGPNVLSVIKGTDLNTLFGKMHESDTAEHYQFSAHELLLINENEKNFYYQDNSGFILDSLMCEYGYVINLDTEELEYYVGFQKDSQEENRYGNEVTYTASSGEEYYPCRLVARFTFAYIQSTPVNTIVENMEKADENKEIDFYDADNEKAKIVKFKSEDVEPSLISIYRKLEGIEEMLTPESETNADSQSRFEQGIKDIDKLKHEMSEFRTELSLLQVKVNKIMECTDLY